MERQGTFIQQAEALQEQVVRFINGLSDAQWRWSPGPNDWSVGRCIEHINVVNGLVIPRMEEAIRQARGENVVASGPFRYPLFDRLFVFGLEPRAPIKTQSPEIYRPSETPDCTLVRQEFLDLHARLLAAAHDADRLDLVRIKVTSPVSDRLRFSLGTWFKGTLAHTRNHFVQAQNVTRKPGFPVG